MISFICQSCGVIAAVIKIFAFLMNDTNKLKWTYATGCVLNVIYAWHLSAWSIVFTNGLLILATTFKWICKWGPMIIEELGWDDNER